jgi:activator of HSP90 ATPase
MNRNVLESIELSVFLPATAKQIYNAWLSSEEHSAFTGGAAIIDPRIGGKFNVWDDYITGTTIELEPYRRIVQTWRTTDFPAGSPDSKLKVLLEEIDSGTKVTLFHDDIPEGQSNEYEQGWNDYYFEPMQKYFKT